ncbi:MAG: hypothetical protein Fur006_13090 [Coleofasciculaceae cyanobacterium]
MWVFMRGYEAEAETDLPARASYLLLVAEATFAALYTDEDMSALVATLLRSRGLDVTTVPKQTSYHIPILKKQLFIPHE